MLARAVDAGIVRILVPGYDVRSSLAAVELAERHPELIDAAVGIHPHYAGEADESAWRRIEDLATARGVVAIGEIGLDFFRNLSPPEWQLDALRRQLDLANRRWLPVLVHDRDAHAAITDELLRWAGPGRTPRGVMHCFSGDRAMALQLSAAGYLVSFALPVSFASAREQRAAAAAVPDGSFLTETDAPWLGAGRERRNEPTTVLRVARELARVRGSTAEQVVDDVRETYQRLVTR